MEYRIVWKPCRLVGNIRRFQRCLEEPKFRHVGCSSPFFLAMNHDECIPQLCPILHWLIHVGPSPYRIFIGGVFSMPSRGWLIKPLFHPQLGISWDIPRFFRGVTVVIPWQQGQPTCKRLVRLAPLELAPPGWTPGGLARASVPPKFICSNWDFKPIWDWNQHWKDQKKHKPWNVHLQHLAESSPRLPNHS
jgi:hypothetical protein